MKKPSMIYRRGTVAIAGIASLFTCFVAWGGNGDKGKQAGAPSAATSAPTEVGGLTIPPSEEKQLAQMLEKDGLVSQVKGFLVEKKGDKLFIDHRQLPDSIAAHYLSSLKQEDITVWVKSIMERQKAHPGASFIQLLMPVSGGSPCIRVTPGC